MKWHVCEHTAEVRVTRCVEDWRTGWIMFRLPLRFDLNAFISHKYIRNQVRMRNRHLTVRIRLIDLKLLYNIDSNIHTNGLTVKVSHLCKDPPMKRTFHLCYLIDFKTTKRTRRSLWRITYPMHVSSLSKLIFMPYWYQLKPPVAKTRTHQLRRSQEKVAQIEFF